jgi:DnaJ-class molecular chaperone
MADPYKTLGVEKTATEEDIRKAYKKLAKKHHPDLNPGDKAAENRFKDISAAYALLNDPEKRRAFDAGEIDETGQPKPERRFYRDYADAGAGFRYERPEDMGDLGDTSLAICSAGAHKAAAKALVRSSACAAPT